MWGGPMSVDPGRSLRTVAIWGALAIAFWTQAFNGFGATGLPELDDGKELWSGELGGAEFRLIQVPERTLV